MPSNDLPIVDSDAITPTKTALVLDLADGRRVELTAHVRTARDDGLRAIEEEDLSERGQPDTQRVFQAATTRFILRDVDAEDDDPIGLLPVSDLDHHQAAGPDPPDGWSKMEWDAVRQKLGYEKEFAGPCYEHESMEAWCKTEKLFHNGMPYFHIVIEGGDPAGGIWTQAETYVPDYTSLPSASSTHRAARSLMAEYEHRGGGGDAE